jgi:hypothetical protein
MEPAAAKAEFSKPLHARKSPHPEGRVALPVPDERGAPQISAGPGHDAVNAGRLQVNLRPPFEQTEPVY